MGEFEPLQELEGAAIAVIHSKDDVEDQLVVSKDLYMYSKEQIQELLEFQERFFTSEILMD